jgi:hypothetical protein
MFAVVQNEEGTSAFEIRKQSGAKGMTGKLLDAQGCRNRRFHSCSRNRRQIHKEAAMRILRREVFCALYS